ncbi:uncharacterized protein KY384_000687 [Bacidia gigantensis]|uniref:uncharacterized protein n=1 Tax=Bacidia gigantensis TaxID=2732470 RepID=UPI001D036630|nr:uncharacterized protein KY384_000687 [Bacidia gigantensis]KAG8525925.1 hypothetical protein KY384_000687 [Bacidia gigantensis]
MSAIPKGSLVLVTGANGLVGSHVVDQLLAAGYNVRGTVRTESKGAWLKTYCDDKYGENRFQVALVPDMASKGAFNEAIKDPSNSLKVIPGVVQGIRDVLESALSEPSVKRFVFTSSSTAATNPKPDVSFSIPGDMWNAETVEQAWAPPPYTPDRKWDVYGASKTQAEQELWKFVNDHKKDIGFVANAILPNAMFGRIIDPTNQPASTAGWITGLYSNGFTYQQDIAPQYFINVADSARLHVAALIDTTIANERIFGFNGPFNWNDILRVLRKLRPNHKLPEDLEDNKQDLSKVLKRGRAEDILKKHYGVGFTSLEETLKANIAHLE